MFNKNKEGHNPYFSRWFSAIRLNILMGTTPINVTILILVDGFLQYYIQFHLLTVDESHNPYFSRWFSAM